MPVIQVFQRASIVFLLLALPTISFAECAPGDDVSYLFYLANEDTEPHAVFLGQITQTQLVSETSALTEEGWQATHYEYQALFSGLRGDRRGFKEPVSGAVQVKATKIEGITIPFALPPVEEEAIFFFELTTEGWVIRAGGCGGLWMLTKNPEVTSDAILCLANDGNC